MDLIKLIFYMLDLSKDMDSDTGFNKYDLY
jgi:hypothetical protein